MAEKDFVEWHDEHYGKQSVNEIFGYHCMKHAYEAGEKKYEDKIKKLEEVKRITIAILDLIYEFESFEPINSEYWDALDKAIKETEEFPVKKDMFCRARNNNVDVDKEFYVKYCIKCGWKCPENPNRITIE